MATIASKTTLCGPLSMPDIIPGANMAEDWCATPVISNTTIPLMQECCGSWQEVYNHDGCTWCNIAWPDAENNMDFTLSFSRCLAVNAEERRVERPGIWRCNTPRFETGAAATKGVGDSHETADSNGVAATNGVTATKGLVLWKIGVVVVLLGVASC